MCKPSLQPLWQAYSTQNKSGKSILGCLYWATQLFQVTCSRVFSFFFFFYPDPWQNLLSSHPYPLLAQSQQTHPGLSNMKHISADLHCLTLLPMYLLNKSHSPMLFSPLCQHWFRLSSITQQSWRWPGTRWSPGLPDEYEPDYRTP